jgi:2-methylcitrate dehydratase PrpD
MDSMSKPLHAGHAAEAGVLAAAGAREGVTGSLDVIEGEAGFGRAMSDGPDWDKALATLGHEHHITMMTFKNHACCGHTFAAIDGAQEAQRQLGVKAQDIARVRVGSYRAAKEVSGYENPTTPAEARFSLKYVVATALAHGSVRLAAFEPDRMKDALTRELMQKIEVAIDPELDAAFPGQRAARVSIETRDGRKTDYLQPARKGDPELPLTDRDLEDKFLELASPVIGEAAARARVARLWSLEEMPDMAAALA